MKSLGSGLHCLSMSIIVVAVVGCGGNGTSNGSSSSSTTSGPAGTATLLPSVKIIDSTQADYLVSATGTTWTLRAPTTINSGGVLLLQDAAVKVLAVDTSSGHMVLTVTPAQIEDVFSKLSIKKTFDQNSAEFIPDQTISIPTTFGPTTASTAFLAAVNGTNTVSLKIPFNRPPWTANLEFKLVGKVNVDFDGNTGMTGSLDVTGIVEGDAGLGTNQATPDLSEIPLGRLRIPIPLSIVGGLPNIIGIHVASIQIPLSLGAKAGLNWGITFGIKGRAEAQSITTYDPINGLSGSGPTVSASLDLSGLPSTTVPTAPINATVTIGPYVRAKPQLVILNQVGSIGVDVKVGLYGKGSFQSMLSTPHFCINLNPVVEGEGAGFFRSVVLGTIQSPSVTAEMTVGLPWRFPAVFGGSPCNGVQFGSSTYSVSQSDGSATITVMRTGDDSKVATVQYATSDGTAVAGRDYTATSGTVTFNPNDLSETFTIPLLNSSLSQGGTVSLILSQPSSEMSLGTPNTAILTIAPSRNSQPPYSNIQVNIDITNATCLKVEKDQFGIVRVDAALTASVTAPEGSYLTVGGPGGISTSPSAGFLYNESTLNCGSWSGGTGSGAPGSGSRGSCRHDNGQPSTTIVSANFIGNYVCPGGGYCWQGELWVQVDSWPWAVGGTATKKTTYDFFTNSPTYQTCSSPPSP
jgi:hypothetical protein